MARERLPNDMEPEPGDSSGLETRCHGTGVLECRCMGDGCCCGFYGSTECYGCEDCEWDGDDRDAYLNDEDPTPLEAGS
jgi:hypothetical protein